MIEKQQRLPRFERDAMAAGSFQFTQRDLEILRHVSEHRFIRSEWIIKLVGGSRQQLLRRLNLLYHHGYLERPRAQLDYYHQGGSKSLVYGLASRGAGRLRRDLDMPFHRMEWKTGNKRTGRVFLEHTLMVSDFMAALEIDCRARPELRLVYSHELPKPNGRENNREPFRWTVDLPGRCRIGVVPDKVFALEVTRSDNSSKRIPYFLEADRGSMPIDRRNPRLSSIAGKLMAYQETYRKKVLQARLGPRFVVLIIANSIERCKNITTAISKIVNTRGFALALSEQELASCNCRAFEITAGLGLTLSDSTTQQLRRAR